MDLQTQLLSFYPQNEQEERDLPLIREALEEPDIFERTNETRHFTASSWIVNHDRSKVLMAYHNIYDSWAWSGGHADGDRDLLAVALREAKEETGVEHIRPVTEEILSVEILTVDGHVKRGRYVPSHLHLNCTFLLEADENDPLIVKPDENQGVQWFTVEDLSKVVKEPWMLHHIYSKLIKKTKIIPAGFSERGQ